ncbi:hypothetical protein BGZ63DRAFT_514270 [Mariannaea sp. PMI_226]|nr:hypothetical protein BGZ63DRAFT_514270 [Mariannaea sp. PMI_226]
MANPGPKAYQPLKDQEYDNDLEAIPGQGPGLSAKSPWKHHKIQLAIATPWLMLIILLISIQIKSLPLCRNQSAQILYSPAQDEIEYKTTRFTQGFENDKSSLQGPPTKERDREWESLYEFGLLAISKNEAALLPNRTGRIANTEDKYFVELDVFHQLHCLNMIRMSRYPEYYRNLHTSEADEILTYFDSEHIEHCIDTIRQSLMCQTDITPLVYQWDNNKERMRIHGDVIHSCRNFDRIREWAKEKSFMSQGLKLDLTQNLMDD